MPGFRIFGSSTFDVVRNNDAPTVREAGDLNVVVVTPKDVLNLVI